MRFWRWAMLAVLAACLMQTATTPASAQDPVECTFLLPADPSDLEWLPPEVRDANCIERDRFTAGGRQFLVADFVGYSGGLPDRIEAVREATQLAVAYYGSWFSVPDTIFIFGRIDSLRRIEGRGQALAATTGDNYSCVVSVESAAEHAGRLASDDRIELMHTIAHELFHCVQRTDRTLHNSYVVWRDEGTAEYFSGRAIPGSTYNSAYGRHMDQLVSQPLYELNESAAPFIFYLGAQQGEEAVVNLLRGASRGTTPNHDLETLRRTADIEDLWHRFVVAWVDGLLVDFRGRQIDVPVASYGPAQPVERAQVVTVGSTSPFMVAGQLYTLNDSMAWELRAPDDRNARASWRIADEADWLQLPTTIDSCSEPTTGVIIVTQVQGDWDGLYEQRVDILERPGRMVNCRCPLGTWNMDLEALRESPLGRGSAGELISGSVTITFGPDRVVGEFRGVTMEAAIDRNSSIRTITHGTIIWNWVRRPWDRTVAGEPPGRGGEIIDAMMIERTVVDSALRTHVEFWARGSMVSRQPGNTQPRRDQGSVSLHTAWCTPRDLTLRSTNGVGDGAGPPWVGTFQTGRGGP